MNSELVSKFIKSPKPYQLEICNQIQNKEKIIENSIIYLETGKGKTFISIILIAHLLQYKKNAKIFFQVCETSLLKQQQDNIELELGYDPNIKVSKLSKVQKSQDSFQNLLKLNSIIISTPAVLLQSLILGHVKITEIDLIVFDECHHCDKDHAYAMIMKEFQYFYLVKGLIDIKQLPRIIGLTASPVKQSFKNDMQSQTRETVTNLCQILNCKMVIDPDIVNQVNDYKNIDGLENLSENEASRNQIKVLDLNQSQNYDDLIKILKEEFLECLYDNNLLMEQSKQINKKYDKKIEIDDIRKFQEAKIESKNLQEYNKVLQLQQNLQKFKNKSDQISIIENFTIDLFHIIENLDQNSVKDYFIYQIEFLKNKYDSDQKDDNILNFINRLQNFINNNLNLNFQTDRLKKLKNQLKETFKSKSNPKIIIFVKNRIVSKLLSEILNKFIKSEINENYECTQVVGTTNESSDKLDTKMSVNDMNDRLSKFNKDENQKILIGTSTIEEGIDIKSCNMVICQTEIFVTKTFVQMKGRARQNKSDFVLFTQDEDNTKKKIKSFIDSIKFTRTMFENNISFDPRIKDSQDYKKIYQIDQKDYQFNSINHSKVTINSVPLIFNTIEQNLKEQYKTEIKIEDIQTNKSQNQNGISNQFKYKAYIPSVLSLQSDIITLESNEYANKKAAQGQIQIKIIEQLHQKNLIDNNFKLIK